MQLRSNIHCPARYTDQYSQQNEFSGRNPVSLPAFPEVLRSTVVPFNPQAKPAIFPTLKFCCPADINLQSDMEAKTSNEVRVRPHNSYTRTVERNNGSAEENDSLLEGMEEQRECNHISVTCKTKCSPRFTVDAVPMRIDRPKVLASPYTTLARSKAKDDLSNKTIIELLEQMEDRPALVEVVEELAFSPLNYADLALLPSDETSPSKEEQEVRKTQRQTVSKSKPLFKVTKTKHVTTMTISMQNRCAFNEIYNTRPNSQPKLVTKNNEPRSKKRKLSKMLPPDPSTLPSTKPNRSFSAPRTIKRTKLSSLRSPTPPPLPNTHVPTFTVNTIAREAAHTPTTPISPVKRPKSPRKDKGKKRGPYNVTKQRKLAGCVNLKRSEVSLLKNEA